MKLLKLDQALHGYADGHRQLAISAALKPRDQKTLLSLSDISGPGARLDESGYITGYPLTESGYYALARTWPAPELPRPGCVWTHTILINFADLASLDRPEELLDLFRRPEVHLSTSYSEQLTLSPSAEIGEFDIDDTWVRSILYGIYCRAPSPIFARRSRGALADRAAVAIWGQQWPRLRRSFRFCTLSISNRSSDNNIFDLQLVSSENRTGRNHFSGTVDAETLSSSLETWIDDALSDLRRPNIDGLRDFLRRSGSDISSGRKSFPALCRLFRALGFADGRVSVDEAIAILQNELRATEAGSLRAVVVNYAVSSIGQLGPDAFDFVWSHKDLINRANFDSHGTEFGSALWRRNPVLLEMLLDEPDPFRTVVDDTIRAMNVTDLVHGLPAAPLMIKKALNIRPEIVQEPVFWSQNDGPLAFQCASLNNMAAKAVAAMMQAPRSDLAAEAVAIFGARIVLDQVHLQIENGNLVDTAWVIQSAKDPIAVAEFLSGSAKVPQEVLVQLAQHLTPDSVPNEIGVDPWFAAYQNSSGTVAPEQALSLFTFLLSRALGNKSHSKSALLQRSFQEVYQAAAANRLTTDQWQLLNDRVPSSSFWFSWDRCKRLRVALVDLFLNGVVDPGSFACIVQDERLLRSLAEEAAGKTGGRRFLKNVRHILQNADGTIDRRRLELIDDVLD
ncbi:hypothetical protein [Rhizobium sp. PP-CC-3G-465]|uniref:GAP1-N1 domain-containing protein n=1 Tax=Rhizobium sp. PP-CC-3G-465 TaxID=2135648 RepID=UPI0010482363